MYLIHVCAVSFPFLNFILDTCVRTYTRTVHVHVPKVPFLCNVVDNLIYIVLFISEMVLHVFPRSLVHVRCVNTTLENYINSDIIYICICVNYVKSRTTNKETTIVNTPT